MRLRKNIDFPAFFQALHQCDGEVLFVTTEGDRLNLKSTLSQLIFTAVIAGTIDILDGTLELTKDTDTKYIESFWAE